MQYSAQKLYTFIYRYGQLWNVYDIIQEDYLVSNDKNIPNVIFTMNIILDIITEDKYYIILKPT